jgi:hypothetical protein
LGETDGEPSACGVKLVVSAAVAIYLRGIDTEEIIATVHASRAPVISATAGLQL